MMRAVIMADDYNGQGKTLAMIRETAPHALPDYQIVQIEMTLAAARRLARAALNFDDRLCDVEAALCYLGQAARDGGGDDDLACTLRLLAQGLQWPERDDDALMRLHRCLTDELEYPDATPGKETPECP